MRDHSFADVMEAESPPTITPQLSPGARSIPYLQGIISEVLPRRKFSTLQDGVLKSGDRD
jgi:hypothetical protein